jgi:enoyl-CoA hydratase
MASFLLLSCDYRVGAQGAYRITANEVAIGLTMPRAAVEICRQRLTPAHFQRAVVLADVFTPDDAVAAGFLDKVTPAADVVETAQEVARAFAALDPRAHVETKLRARSDWLSALSAATDADDADLAALVAPPGN